MKPSRKKLGKKRTYRKKYRYQEKMIMQIQYYQVGSEVLDIE